MSGDNQLEALVSYLADQTKHGLRMGRKSAEAAVRRALSLPCQICGASTIHGVGLFIPGQEQGPTFGRKPGMERAILYALCNSCQEAPGTRAKIEESLMANPELRFGQG